MFCFASLLQQWLHLCVDLESLVSGLFRAHQFKSLEWICVRGSCSLRRVFTLKSTPSPESGEEFPRSCQMPSGAAQPLTVVRIVK